MRDCCSVIPADRPDVPLGSTCLLSALSSLPFLYPYPLAPLTLFSTHHLPPLIFFPPYFLTLLTSPTPLLPLSPPLTPLTRRIMRNIEFRTWYRNQPLGDSNEAESVRRESEYPWEGE